MIQGVTVIEVWSDMVDQREWDREAMYRTVADVLDGLPDKSV